MKMAALMVLACVACSPSQELPTYVSAMGTAVSLVYVDPSHPSRAEADAMEAQLLSGMGRNGWPLIEMRRAMKLGVVEFTDEAFGCVGSKDAEKCAGQLYGDVAKVVASPGCEVNSAYRHELAHRLSREVAGNADAAHLDATIWDVADAPMSCGQDGGL